MQKRSFGIAAACVTVMSFSAAPMFAENDQVTAFETPAEYDQAEATARGFLVMDAETIAEIRGAYANRDVIHNRLVATQAITVSSDQTLGNAFFIDMARVTIDVLAENGHNVSGLRAEYEIEYDRYLAAN